VSTQQQGIVEALALLMATVAGVTTVSKNRPHDEPFGLNQLPAINVSAVGSEVIGEHSAGTDERLTVILSAFCTGSTASNSSTDLLSSALGKIGADDSIGGLAIDSRKVKRITTSVKTEVLSAEAHQEITIDYRTPRWGF
jgi:hypothetical protein